MKYGILAIAALALAGCTASQEEQTSSIAQVSSKLPDGCQLNYLGEVAVAGEQYGSRVFVVECDNTTTVSTSNEYSVGKNTYTSSSIAFAEN